MKKAWKKKEAHGKASARALTAAEIGERAQGKKQRQRTPDKDYKDAILVPETPPRVAPPPSTAPAGLAGAGKRKRKATAVYTAARQAGQVPSLGHSQ